MTDDLTSSPESQTYLRAREAVRRMKEAADHDISVSGIDLREGVEVGAADSTRPSFAEPVSALVP